MPRKALDREMEKVKRDIMEMTELVSKAVLKAIAALEKNDRDLARKVGIEDDLINEYETQIKKRSIQTIALQQPVAKDLRIISVSMDVAYNLERIGDFARDIAMSLEYIDDGYVILEEITKMGKLGAQMVRDAGDAFVNERKEKIDTIMQMEDEVDKIYKSVFPILKKSVEGGEGKCSNALNLILISKFLERIADHSVNITNRAMYEIYGKEEYL
ncbi:MAG: phosphate signaling complex protein PhoU [Candidatus Altiarchaeota archaeon]|nr:phosphate signaling complex protein PhoU [Candidatus Altiarchaeota archaeon]